MNHRMYKALVLLVVAAALVGAVAWRLHARGLSLGPSGEAGGAEATPALPALVDLGKGTCEACKAMKPILDKLAQEYEGRARVEVIDISKRPEEVDRYGINLIPTQVFLDAEGRETYRHEGFMPKEEIVARLQAMGVK